jgi:hypothetical protein
MQTYLGDAVKALEDAGFWVTEAKQEAEHEKRSPDAPYDWEDDLVPLPTAYISLKAVPIEMVDRRMEGPPKP